MCQQIIWLALSTCAFSTHAACCTAAATSVMCSCTGYNAREAFGSRGDYAPQSLGSKCVTCKLSKSELGGRRRMKAGAKAAAAAGLAVAANAAAEVLTGEPLCQNACAAHGTCAGHANSDACKCSQQEAVRNSSCSSCLRVDVKYALAAKAFLPHVLTC